MELGATFVGGRSKENARALLRAADRAGVGRERVKTVSDGYLVPNEVADALGDAPSVTEPTPVVATETADEDIDLSQWRWVDLNAEAKRRGLPSGGTKADLIARLEQGE